MTTRDLINVLNSHREIIKVDLEKPTNARDFWNQLRHDVSEMDSGDFSEISFAMYEFGYNDELDLVNKSGKIMKRFAKFYKTSTGKTLDEKTMGVIGGKIANYVNKQASLYLDFTDNFDWKDGQFGHRGSCWWGMYGASLPSFQNGGGWCVRFYNDENQNDNNGIGRTWVMPKDNLLMCFNSYGVERAETSKAIKAVFAKHGIELHFKSAGIENSNNSTIPYINGGTGFVLYTDESDLTRDGDYDIDVEVEDDDCETCCDCGERVYEEDGRCEDGDFYCDSCWSDRFTSCDHCGETCSYDEIINVTGSRRYDSLCRYCAERQGFTPCEHCGDWVNDYTVTDDTGYCYCENCQDDLCFCQTCEKTLEDQDEHDICDECKAEKEKDESEEETQLTMWSQV